MGSKWHIPRNANKSCNGKLYFDCFQSLDCLILEGPKIVVDSILESLHNGLVSETKQTRKQKNQGMNWIRPVKRLAIYLRDGMACCYCGLTLEDGAKLTLDHLVCHSKGGSNEATNLITACSICNSSRGTRSWRVFSGKVAGYLNGASAEQIIKHISRTRLRVLDLEAAAKLMDNRKAA